MAVHDQFADQAAAYALGALSPDDARTFEAHVAVCAACAAEVRGFAPVVAGIAGTASPAEPSSTSRDKLLTSVGRVLLDPATGDSASAFGGSKRTRPTTRASEGRGYLAAAAALVAAVALGAYAAQLRGRVGTLESRLEEATLRANLRDREMADARRAAFEAQSTIAVLAAPDLARIDLAGQPAAPSAAARAFWSRSRGLVFTASNLPAPPPGRTYQLWVLTKEPAPPISAGILKPDATGRATVMFETPVDLPQPVAMAVTLEPEGGVPAPTGDTYLVGAAP